MKIVPEVRAHLPQRDAAAAAEDAAAGHHDRGEPGHAVGGQAAQRRNDPRRADGAERRLRRVPRGPRRRNAGVPAGAARGSGRRACKDNGRTCRRAQALPADGAPTAEITQRTRNSATTNIEALDPQLPPARWKPSAARTTARAAGRRVEHRVRDVRQRGRERPAARCGCCPARWKTTNSGLGKLARVLDVSARRCTSSTRSPRARAGAGSHQQARRSRRRRSSRTRSARSLAKSSRSSTNSRPRPSRLAKRLPAPGDELLAC